MTQPISTFLKWIEGNVSADYLFCNDEMDFTWYHGGSISISTTESLVQNRLTPSLTIAALSGDIWYRNQVKQ